jgi:hypothetical protein
MKLQFLLLVLSSIILCSGCQKQGGDNIKPQKANYSKTEVEEYILKILDDIDEITMHDYYKSKKDGLIFEYHDLNDDGLDEVIVCNRSIAGAQNAPQYVFTIEPVKMVGEIGWACYYEILKSKRNGYYDLILYNHWSAFKSGVWTMMWDGTKYVKKSSGFWERAETYLIGQSDFVVDTVTEYQTSSSGESFASVKYPRISSLSNSDFKDSLNDYFKKVFYTELEPTIYGLDEETDRRRFTFERKFFIEAFINGILCVTQLDTEHENYKLINESSRCHLMNIHTGQFYNFKDLFVDGYKYRLVQTIKKKLGVEHKHFPRELESVSDNPDYWVDNKYVYIKVNFEYLGDNFSQIMPVSLDAIQNIINPGGPLALIYDNPYQPVPTKIVIGTADIGTTFSQFLKKVRYDHISKTEVGTFLVSKDGDPILEIGDKGRGDSIIKMLTVISSSIITTAGLYVGMSIEEILTKYPNAKLEEHDGGEYYAPDELQTYDTCMMYCVDRNKGSIDLIKIFSWK